MTPREKELIFDLSAHGLRHEDFLRQFRPGNSDGMELSRQLLEEALSSGMPDEVEYALIVGFTFRFSPSHLEALSRLSEADWHFKHEDVVTALGQLKDRGAVEALYRSALKRYRYLDFDDSRALAVKAIWALGQIQDISAEKKLERLAQSDEKIIRNEALNQLRRRRIRTSLS